MQIKSTVSTVKEQQKETTFFRWSPFSLIAGVGAAVLGRIAISG